MVGVRISCAGSLKFKFCAGQILHSIAKVHHFFNIYASNCVALAQWHGDGHYILITYLSIIQQVIPWALNNPLSNDEIHNLSASYSSHSCLLLCSGNCQSSEDWLFQSELIHFVNDHYQIAVLIKDMLWCINLVPENMW